MTLPRPSRLHRARLGLLLALVAPLACAGAAPAPASPAPPPTSEPSPTAAVPSAAPASSGTAAATGSTTAAPSSTPAASGVHAPPPSRLPVMLLASGALLTANVGALLLLGAETRLARVRELADETNRSCRPGDPRPTASCAELFSAARDTDLMGNLAIGTLVAAGLLGAGAGVLVLVPARTATSKPQNPSLTAAPWWGVDAAGGIVRGSF